MTLSPETDWRGPIGTLNRQIMPYLLSHRHSDPKELIPWYKLALRFNPNLERLYVLGAFFMSDFAHEPDEALELLQAGVQANPWSFEIPAALGRLYFEVLKDNEKAVSTLKNAVANGKTESASLAERKEKFDDYQKQLFKESYLFLARAYTDQGKYDDALAACDEGLKQSGDHMLVVQRRITEKKRAENDTPPSGNEASSGS
jgi:tetratricopeptide (TPR) repeat protein